MTEQSQLFHVMPRFHIGDSPTSLMEIVNWMRDDVILTPKFQRELVWEPWKIAGWGKTIIANNPVGCIVTYQVKGFGPVYLADGLQRTLATQRLLDNLFRYMPKLAMDVQQFAQYVSACRITVQHRHYESHDEAFEAFQNLNMGTSATPFEYYKGELALLDDRGDLVLTNIPRIVSTAEQRFLSGRKHHRAMQQKLYRDAFALFYQYLSGSDQIDFSNVSATKVGPGQAPIERKLMRYIKDENVTMEDLKQYFKSFELFLAGYAAELETHMIDSGQRGKAMAPVVSRLLMHLYCWRKNTRRSNHLYWEFVDHLLDYLKPYQEIVSRFPLPNSDPVRVVTFRLGGSKGVAELCRAWNLEFYIPQRRQKTKVAAIGFHESHIQPHSLHGNGETIFEPSPSNLSRGAKPMFDKDRP